MNNINIGCGSKHLEGYINIDMVQPADSVIDLELAKLPYEDNSVDNIMADNVLEHIHNLPALMDECYRVLKSGGVMRVIVPLFPSPAAVADPTHVRFFVPETFDRFKFTPCNLRTYGERFQFIEVDLTK